MKRIAVVLIISCFLAMGCAPQLTRGERYVKLYEQKPSTILVMPPINNTTNEEAKELLYTSISVPLAESGYYVISPYLTMDVLKSENTYNSEAFIYAPLTQFREKFGADAVIFSVIDTWEKQAFGIRTNIRYIMKSTLTNDVLFEKSCDLYLNMSPNTRLRSKSYDAFDALFDIAASAVETAVTDHIEAARKANYYIFNDIPYGKYHPDYMQDQNVGATAKELQAMVR